MVGNKNTLPTLRFKLMVGNKNTLPTLQKSLNYDRVQYIITSDEEKRFFVGHFQQLTRPLQKVLHYQKLCLMQ